MTAILSEFLRGAAVIARQSGRNFFVGDVSADPAQHAALWRLYDSHRRGDRGHRSGRRGLQSQRGKRDGAARQDGASALTRWSAWASRRIQTQITTANTRCSMCMPGGRSSFQMSPEKRVYLASGQPQTMVAIHSTVPAGICMWCMRDESRHRPADHQGDSESAGELDLGRLRGLCNAASWGHADRAGSQARRLRYRREATLNAS